MEDMSSMGLPKIQFGLELEHDAGDNYDLDALAKSLYSTGYGYNDKPYGHHSMLHHPFFFHKRGWLTELELSVSGGEVISPVMVDSDETWEALSTVLSTIRSHGGVSSSIDSSCHIHIDTSLFAQDVDVWRRFFSSIYHFEDLLRFIGTDHVRGFHRGDRNSRFSNIIEGVETHSDFIGLNTRYTNVLSTRYVDVDTGFGHVEYRMNDASLDMKAIRAQVACLVSMAWSAVEGRKIPKDKDLSSFLGTFLVDFPLACELVEGFVGSAISASRGLGTSYQSDYAQLC